MPYLYKIFSKISRKTKRILYLCHMILNYDVIVIGGGHAGCEAATASANMGAKTYLVTMDMNKIAQMSCNPAIGGIAKGQIVREIDALGGQMALVTDATAIQFRMLNRSKGPAVWSPRAQCDRGKFIWKWRSVLDETPNFHDHDPRHGCDEHPRDGELRSPALLAVARTADLHRGRPARDDHRVQQRDEDHREEPSGQ